MKRDVLENEVEWGGGLARKNEVHYFGRPAYLLSDSVSFGGPQGVVGVSNFIREHGGPACVPYTFGLLEHMNEGELMLLKRTLEPVWLQVHYVPLEGHMIPSFGDERLLPASYWIDLFSPYYWEKFNEGKDLVFVVKPFPQKAFDYLGGFEGWEVHGD